MDLLAQPIGNVVPVIWPHMRDLSWIRVFFPLMLETIIITRGRCEEQGSGEASRKEEQISFLKKLY